MHNFMFTKLKRNSATWYWLIYDTHVMQMWLSIHIWYGKTCICQVNESSLLTMTVYLTVACHKIISVLLMILLILEF